MRAILHVDKQWGIGKDNKLLFSIPEDMKFFKQTTTGNVVVMGHNTLKSLPRGRPLKDRVNIVLSHSSQKRDDCIMVSNVDELFAEIKKYPPEKVFVIGGAMLYKLLLPYCTEVLVTKVDAVGGADTFFENLDINPNFALCYSSNEMDTNGYTIKFTTYKNLKVSNF